MNPNCGVTTRRSDSRPTPLSAPLQMPLLIRREAIAGTGARQTQFWIRVLRKANERIASKNLQEL
jgi:hypothetical protein